MSIFTICIKLIVAVILSCFAGLMAAKSVKETTDGKERISTAAFGTIILAGIVVGVVAAFFPIGWMFHAVFLFLMLGLQLMNTEGRYRAACGEILRKI